MGLLNRMRLSYSEQYLDNDTTTLLDYNISKECLLHLIIGDEDFVNPSSGESNGNSEGGMNDWAAMEAAMAAASEMASQQQAAAMNSGSPSSSRPGTASSNPASSVGGSPSTAGGGSRPFTEEDLNQITINFMDVATGDTEGIKGKSFHCVLSSSQVVSDGGTIFALSKRVRVAFRSSQARDEIQHHHSQCCLTIKDRILPMGLVMKQHSIHYI